MERSRIVLGRKDGRNAIMRPFFFQNGRIKIEKSKINPVTVL